jgi:hypothetical protein
LDWSGPVGCYDSPPKRSEQGRREGRACRCKLTRC